MKRTCLNVRVVCSLTVLVMAPVLWASSSEPPYDGSWESLQKIPVPAWFEDGKRAGFPVAQTARHLRKSGARRADLQRRSDGTSRAGAGLRS